MTNTEPRRAQLQFLPPGTRIKFLPDDFLTKAGVLTATVIEQNVAAGDYFRRQGKTAVWVYGKAYQRAVRQNKLPDGVVGVPWHPHEPQTLVEIGYRDLSEFAQAGKDESYNDQWLLTKTNQVFVLEPEAEATAIAEGE